MNRLQIIFILWLAWGGTCLAALAFIIGRPKVWASWVDKENNYWVARGRLASGLAERIKKLEKGLTMKILLGANVLLSLVVICLLLRSAGPRPFRARLPPPPVPVPRRQPAH